MDKLKTIGLVVVAFVFILFAPMWLLAIIGAIEVMILTAQHIVD